jgi:PBP1b-binding outer membrane lipoprotein LpoB
MKKISRYFLLTIIILGITIVFTGCTGYAPYPELHAHVESKSDFSLGLGCYERVSGYVYNSGTGPANNAKITLTLVNTNTGTIVDSKVVSLGYIEKGGSRNFETILDRDCGGNYRIDTSLD